MLVTRDINLQTNSNSPGAQFIEPLRTLKPPHLLPESNPCSVLASGEQVGEEAFCGFVALPGRPGSLLTVQAGRTGSRTRLTWVLFQGLPRRIVCPSALRSSAMPASDRPAD